MTYYMYKLKLNRKIKYIKILKKPNQSKGWDGKPRVFI